MLAESMAYLGMGLLGGYLLGRGGFAPWVGSAPGDAAAETSRPPASLPTVEEEIARGLRQGMPLALFTLAWETPDGGDTTQRLIEPLLNRLVRPYDAIVSLGSGRYVLVLPQVGAAAADAVATRLLQELAMLGALQLEVPTAPLPRVIMTAPASVARLMGAMREAVAKAACWRGSRAQTLRLGLVILERPSASRVVPRVDAGGEAPC